MTVQTEVAPRPVFCPIAHVYRNRALAEAVCAGCFTHLGVTLDLGLEPDWRGAGLPTDEEWRIEWHKFYYGLDLAWAFHETGEPRYLRAWERLIRSWIAQMPAGCDPSDVAGRRIQNWIYAWSGFAAAPAFGGLSEGLAESILASLAAQVRHLREHLTRERNHRTLELYALFIAALALPQIDPGGALLDFAIAELHHNLLTDILPDGVQRECSTHYHMIVLRSFLGARENARRFGLRFPASYDDRLERACEFALHCHRPDGAIPALSDSDTGSYADILELAATLLGRPDFRYSATSGARGAPPAQRYVSFPDGGYFTQRSGWGAGRVPFAQERFLIFDCGPLGAGGHGHYDLLNVEIAAGGRPLIIDAGRYTYAEHPPNWRRWFKSTAAHNTVCVDRLDQTPYQRGKPKGPVAQGRLHARRSAPGFDLLCGEASSPAYEAIHTRWVLFIADEYWIIVDQLRGARPHRYDLRFQLAPEAWGDTTIGSSLVQAPGLALVFNAPSAPQIEPGWVAPTYGTKLPAPVVSVVADGVVDADFVTLVIPQEAGTPTPTLNVHPAGAALLVEVDGAGPDNASRDRVMLSAVPERFVLGPFQGRAPAAWLRESGSGENESFCACDALTVMRTTNGATEVLTSRAGPGWLRWDAQQGVTRGGRDDL